MPPAFNLSQDQTLQFDLEFKVFRLLTHLTESRKISLSSLLFCERLFLVPKNFGNRLQTPTLIGCTFLKTPFKSTALEFTSLRSAKPCIVAQLSLQLLKRFHVFFSSLNLMRRRKRPALAGRLDKSLTMTYFHTGTRTIIGAKSFHCPVRDGKEWDQLAMVIRHNLCGCSSIPSNYNLNS